MLERPDHVARSAELAWDSEAATYRDRARRLGLPFVTAVDTAGLVPGDAAAIRAGRFALSSPGEGTAYIAPEEPALAPVRRWLSRYPSARGRLCVATPSAIRAAL